MQQNLTRAATFALLTTLTAAAFIGFSHQLGHTSDADRAGGHNVSDWPNWRGPHHDGISRATGLLEAWPPNGPRLAWQRPLPGGYSSVVVSQGRLITPTKEKNEEIILCLDAAMGKELWAYRYPCDYDAPEIKKTLDQRFKTGPRATPAVDGGRAYSIGTTGILLCLDLKSGKLIWRRDLLKIGNRTCPEFGYCNSPFIAGDRLYVHSGGQDGNSLVALDKKTGDILWNALDDPIGQATPILVDFNGSKQLIDFTAEGAIGVSPDNGKLLWRHRWKTNFDLNVATPIYSNGHVFISSNYGKGAALLRLKPGQDPEVAWTSQVMQNHITTSILFEGHLYGFSGDRLRCVEFETGKMKWDKTGLGRGSLLIADKKLIILGEQGDLVLAEARPDQFAEKSRWRALEGTCWAVPVLAEGYLFLRNEKQLKVFVVTK